MYPQTTFLAVKCNRFAAQTPCPCHGHAACLTKEDLCRRFKQHASKVLRIRIATVQFSNLGDEDIQLIVGLVGDLHSVVYPSWEAHASEAQRLDPQPWDAKCPSQV